MKDTCTYCKGNIVPDPMGEPSFNITSGGLMKPVLRWVHVDTQNHLCKGGGTGAFPSNPKLRHLPPQRPNIHIPIMELFSMMIQRFATFRGEKQILKMETTEDFDEEFQEEYE